MSAASGEAVEPENKKPKFDQKRFSSLLRIKRRKAARKAERTNRRKGRR